MEREIKFDIRRVVDKAVIFNNDKDRAGKFKENYLKHLCSGLEDSLFFMAVYSELFPSDEETEKMLKKIIDEIVNSADDGVIAGLENLGGIDALYKRYKIYARSTIKNLQKQEIAMIERIQRKTREMEEARRKRMMTAKINESIKISQSSVSSSKNTVKKGVKIQQQGGGPKVDIKLKDLLPKKVNLNPGESFVPKNKSAEGKNNDFFSKMFRDKRLRNFVDYKKDSVHRPKSQRRKQNNRERLQVEQKQNEKTL